MTKPENAVVRERYEKHMASVESKACGLSSHSVKLSLPPVRSPPIGQSGQQPGEFLDRHVSGDWGDIDAHDRNENQLSLEQGKCR